PRQRRWRHRKRMRDRRDDIAHHLRVEAVHEDGERAEERHQHLKPADLVPLDQQRDIDDPLLGHALPPPARASMPLPPEAFAPLLATTKSQIAPPHPTLSAPMGRRGRDPPKRGARRWEGEVGWKGRAILLTAVRRRAGR